jgi:hypothetical protein
MSMNTPDLVVVSPPAVASGSTGSYLEWTAILGGAVLAAAISTLLAAFGSAIGLSMASAEPSRSAGTVAFAIAAGLWAIWITVSANFAGGYLAGRMRRPAGDASDHERHVRDGAHGLVVWAVGALIVTMLATSSITSAVKTAVTGAAAASGGAAALVTQQADPMGSALDSVMRSTGQAQPTASEREEATRIFVTGLTSGKLEQADRDYIASRFAARMNIPQPEAQKRVDDAFAKLNQAKETAKQAAERARKTAVVAAFITAAVLLLGLVVAWFAAQMGGKHRDEEMDLGDLFGRR